MNLTSPKNWKTATLDQVIDLIGGGTPKTGVDEYWNGDIPWLSVVDFNNDSRWVFDAEKKITELGLKNSSTKLLEKGDIIISARGTVGALAQLAKPMTFNQSCYGIRAKENIDQDFIFYLLKFSIPSLVKNVHGAVFDTLTRESFSHVEVRIPESLDEQKEIAVILGSLDDKIELLRRENKTLENMAQTLFKEWFVEFRFPGYEKVKVEGGVPEGWKVGKLGDVCRINYGKNLPTDKLLKSGYPVFGGNGLIGFYDKYIYEDQKVLVSCRGEASGKINISDPCSFVTNNSLVLDQDEKQISFEYLKYMSFFTSYYDYVTGSAQPQITIDSLQICPILVPGKKVIDLFSNSVKSIQEKILGNTKEIQTLSRLRDELLGKIFLN